MLCVLSSGEKKRVSVKIGTPYAEDGAVACPVSLSLYDPLPDIRGEDSVQALSLALSLVRQLLGYVNEDGGQVLHLDGDPIDLDVWLGPRRNTWHRPELCREPRRHRRDDAARGGEGGGLLLSFLSIDRKEEDLLHLLHPDHGHRPPSTLRHRS